MRRVLFVCTGNRSFRFLKQWVNRAQVDEQVDLIFRDVHLH
jgi:hypothetical protein